MVKKLVLLLGGLCWTTPAFCMIAEKRLQKDEVLTFLCEGVEIKLAPHLAKMSEVLMSGSDFEDEKTGLFSLPDTISLSTWKVIEGLLEMVSCCQNAPEDAPQEPSGNS